jgi:hypothetical protein
LIPVFVNVFCKISRNMIDRIYFVSFINQIQISSSLTYTYKVSMVVIAKIEDYYLKVAIRHFNKLSEYLAYSLFYADQRTRQALTAAEFLTVIISPNLLIFRILSRFSCISFLTVDFEK